MMDIIAYRDQVIEQIIESFPAFRDEVHSHPGKFTLDDFKRLSAKAPAAYVAILGAKQGDKLATGEVLFEVHIGVFIATQRTRDFTADAQGWNLALAIANLAKWNYFKSSGLPPDNIEIENLWSTAEDKMQICIMGVAWMVKVTVGADYASALQDVQASGATFVFPANPKVAGSVYQDPEPDDVTVTP